MSYLAGRDDSGNAWTEDSLDVEITITVEVLRRVSPDDQVTVVVETSDAEILRAVRRAAQEAASE